MLETSFGMNFFLKTPSKPSNMKMIYVRVYVDGVPRETSTKRKWDAQRWCDKTNKATGTKEDAKSMNTFLDDLSAKVTTYRNRLLKDDEPITSQKIIEHINGKSTGRISVLEEFELHNKEMLKLVPEEYAMGTYDRYVTAKSHVAEFISFKYGKEDIDFKDLDYDFVADFEFYLKTERKNAKNTALKYISNFKKIVLRAIKKKIIKEDPFIDFESKRVKIKKKPLTSEELKRLEEHNFSNRRLSAVRDIFIFQCYTGLAYIDAFQLKKEEIKKGEEGTFSIYSDRQKTDSHTYIPLLPKAIEIIDKYKDDPICTKRGTVLPVRSNQRMNSYLKEIGDIVGFSFTMNTHMARRTFASTVTLNNSVPINVVKEMLGHQSVKQTEEYALTAQESIDREMKELQRKLSTKDEGKMDISISTILKLENEIKELKRQLLEKSNGLVA